MDLLVSRRALQRVDDRSINTGLPALGYFDSAIVSDIDSCLEFCLGQY